MASEIVEGLVMFENVVWNRYLWGMEMEEQSGLVPGHLVGIGGLFHVMK